MESLIVGPRTALLCKARGKLPTAEKAEEFNQALTDILFKHACSDPDGKIVFEDMDISQNPITADQFEAFFGTLSANNVLVQRMKIFGCPTLDDAACNTIATWLRNCTADTAPWELHLSDGAITADGFNEIMSALEENSVFPVTKMGKSCPMYFRVEGNYINPQAIQEKCEQGSLGQFTRGWQGNSPQQIPDGAKAKLLVQRIGECNQKPGSPPPPEDAPPPKKVWDWEEKQRQQQQEAAWYGKAGKGGKGGKGDWGGEKGGCKGGDAWNGGGKAWPPVVTPPVKGCKGSGWLPVDVWEAQRAAKSAGKAGAGKGGVATVGAATAGAATFGVAMAGAGKGASTTVGAAKGGGKGSWLPDDVWEAQRAARKAAQAAAAQGAVGLAGAANGKGGTMWMPLAASGLISPHMKAGGRGAVGAAADRSRTPAPRQPVAPALPPPSKGLPPGWEEHPSEEYGIPFYWNEATGESAWEKPTA